MSDLISRQDAIDAFTADGTRMERVGITMLTVCEIKQKAVDLLESLQSAEPIKRGTWRYYAKGNDKWAVCSECGIVSIVGGNYCPNCGAKMKGREE